MSTHQINFDTPNKYFIHNLLLQILFCVSLNHLNLHKVKMITVTRKLSIDLEINIATFLLNFLKD